MKLRKGMEGKGADGRERKQRINELKRNETKKISRNRQQGLTGK